MIHTQTPTTMANETFSIPSIEITFKTGIKYFGEMELFCNPVMHWDGQNITCKSAMARPVDADEWANLKWEIGHDAMMQLEAKASAQFRAIALNWCVANGIAKRMEG